MKLDATKETICGEAERLVCGDRNADYGHPYDDFSKTAHLWTGWLRARGVLADGAALEPEDVAAMMIDVKRSRQLNAHKRDNIVDMVGYALTWDLVQRERAARDAVSS